MSPAGLLRTAGLALYGEQWQADLGRALDVNPRQIRRWLSGEYDPPAGVWAELAAACRERRDTLAELAKPLSEAAKGGVTTRPDLTARMRPDRHERRDL